MANGNSLFTFLAGAVTGAALLLLANTEKGEKVVNDIKEKGTEAFENGRAAVLRGLDKIEDALEERRARAARSENGDE
ncbi:MAG: YtxH domain-containing protein [Bacteroidales bacterium]|nr:YtxH domain-containing protein [Bacteroidales bacterium]